jgi:ABC-type nitrate/sulfonate/bicarbonate transport system permease component
LLGLSTNLSGASSDARVSHALVQIGVVVAEIAKSSYRRNILEMFAALLLLSAAGIGIYRLLAPTWHLALRRWRESALGKENGWLRVFRRKRLMC